MSQTMIWVVTPLVIVALIYAVLATAYFAVQHRYGMSLAFVGYVVANVGLVWDALSIKAP